MKEQTVAEKEQHLPVQAGNAPITDRAGSGPECKPHRRFTIGIRLGRLNSSVFGGREQACASTVTAAGELLDTPWLHTYNLSHSFEIVDIQGYYTDAPLN